MMLGPGLALVIVAGMTCSDRRCGRTIKRSEVERRRDRKQESQADTEPLPIAARLYPTRFEGTVPHGHNLRQLVAGSHKQVSALSHES
jgi:hypothetical protein